MRSMWNLRLPTGGDFFGSAACAAFSLALVLLPSGCGESSRPNSRTSGASSPTPGGATDPMDQERREMVERLKEGEIKDERVLEAMTRVPRHLFVDPVYRARAYDAHTPLPIGENQTISAPDIVAIMTQALELSSGDKVLEIGTGSGYQAAVLGELVDEVYTVEIRPSLAATARTRLEDLRKNGYLGFKKIEVVVGDGYEGHPAEAPYDAIIVTAAPKSVDALRNPVDFCPRCPIKHVRIPSKSINANITQ